MSWFNALSEVRYCAGSHRPLPSFNAAPLITANKSGHAEFPHLHIAAIWERGGDIFIAEEVYCQTSVYTSIASPERVVHVQIN